jgi:hypothetical protein
MFLSEPKFCLINATAKNEETLMKELETMFSDDNLRIRY